VSIISVDSQVHDINTIIFALRSVPASETVVNELISELEQAKECMKELKTVSMVYQNFFERNNTTKEEQLHITMNLSDACLAQIKEKTGTLLQLLKPLNYPLPGILLTKTDLQKEEQISDPNLAFEVKLFNWMNNVKKNPMNQELLNELKTKEGFSDLNLQVDEKFLGFLTYGIIVDDWKFKDLRLNKTIDSVLKEWKNKGILDELAIQYRNEFLTLKNGLIIVSTK